MAGKRSRRKGRIKALPQGIRGIPDVATDPYDQEMLFSFKYLDDTCPTYSLDKCDTREAYVRRLLHRLRDLSGMTIKEFKTDRGRTLRSHPIDWDGVQHHDGFGNIPETNDQLYAAAQGDAYQFSLTVNEYGRVVGFFIDNIFHVVWLDPDHLVYPRD